MKDPVPFSFAAAKTTRPIRNGIFHWLPRTTSCIISPVIKLTTQTIMASIPTFESILLEIRQNLGLERIQSKKQTRLIKLEERWQSHVEFMDSELSNIFDALELDAAARRDCGGNLLNAFSFEQALARQIWTLGASQQQVIWHLAMFSYAPGLGRVLANWNLAEPFDKGMPGGVFWFLPIVDPKTHTVVQPVQQVVRWLLDLLGKPMDSAKLDLGGQAAAKDDRVDSIERNLYNWLDKTVPHVKKIGEYFPDDAQMDFRGCFVIPADLPDIALLDAARAFVARKQLDADALRDQIPMTQPGRIEAVLGGSAAVDEVREFTRLLSIRYAVPDMRTLRQRLRIARATQDAYRRLLEFLCPGVEPTCADPSQNKVLQLLGVISYVYDLTIKAYKQNEGQAEEDRWFESQLAPWDKETILLSILPSRFNTAHIEVGQMLTRIFSTLKADDPLPDYVSMSPDDIESTTQRKLELITLLAHDAQRIDATLDRIRRSSAWRVLRDVSDYWIVSQIAQHESLSPKGRAAATERLREVASTPDQTLGAILIELGSLLNAERKKRPADVEKRVATLLIEAEANEAYPRWEAGVLQYRAKDYLAKNDFEKATDYFEKSLDATHTHNHGGLRGEIAHDCLAVMIANGGLDQKKHEKPFRHMLADGSMIEGSASPSLEEAAKAVLEYFWNTLYKPYPGHPVERPIALAEFERMFTETFGFIEHADWDSLNAWLKKNRRSLHKKTLSSVSGDSTLLTWLKPMYEIESRLDLLNAWRPTHLRDSNNQMAAHMANRRKAIAMLVKEWPEQLNLVDFKGQSAIMFAAQQRDIEVLRVLLEAGADVDLQDCDGRTVLHSAVSGGDLECVAAVLARQPKLDKATFDEGSTPLHTAVKMGLPALLDLLLDYGPEWATTKNAFGYTPLEFAEQVIMDDVPAVQRAMQQQGRRVGTQQDYETCVSRLRAAVATTA